MRTVIAAVATLFLLAPVPLQGWGVDAHRYITRRALDHLPPELRQRVIDLRGGARPAEAMATAPHIYLTDYVAEDVSATRVRAEVAAGRPIDQLTPPAVAGYIAKYRLYR